MKIRWIKFILIKFILIISLQSAVSHSFKKQNGESCIARLDSCSYLSEADAEKIMGEPATLTETANGEYGEVYKQRCIYTAVSVEGRSGKKGILYFAIEEYKNISLAQKVFSETVTENEKDAELKDLRIGEQSFLQSTPEVFHLIMIRKKNKILRLKVNKVTGTTSLDEMVRIAERITSAI